MDPDTIDRLAAQLHATTYRATIADAHRWKNTRCVVCDLPFPTWAEWGDRHDTDAGPAHPNCCEAC